MNANILFRYIHELSDAAEREMVVAWLQESEKNRDILAALAQRKLSLEKAADKDSAAADWLKIQTGIQEAPVRKMFPWKRYSAAAAIAALLCTAAWYGVHRPGPVTPHLVKLATTARDKKRITLPDSTEVWLQYNSSITYDAATFHNSERCVTLKGTAFFNVTSNAAQPFRVQTPHTAITVLGTSFHINARENAPQEIAVATGKINVTAEQLNINLLPEQKITYDPVTHKTTSSHISLHQVTGLRDNKLVFENDDLPGIAAKLEQWYNRKIIIRGTPQRVSFTGSVEDNGIHAVLGGLSFLAGIQYQVTADSVILSLQSNSLRNNK
ncbi:FecR family protein [Chitinophaga eiseniae]|uniref:FecR family protein n=1 Tax=Chitinophaga eiseniae TaxID=634771 RepID=A0A847STQ3_9BACT|nr:FecR family protein [Chitinophaga eiseniae]NLR80939.1 FecR family protein [Chitinophaga eiseniae]